MPADNSQDNFFEDLMKDIMLGVKIPKFQIERVVGPILGFFIADVMSSLLCADIITAGAEFPLKKMENSQSTNIDWLMYNRSKNELIFVELKTTDSFNHSQKSLYLKIQEKISERNASFLKDDVITISKKSKESGKYREILNLLKQKSIEFSGIRMSRVVYILPDVVKRKMADEDKEVIEFFSFKELRIDPSIKVAHRKQWEVLRKNLCELDEITRKSRNA